MVLNRISHPRKLYIEPQCITMLLDRKWQHSSLVQVHQHVCSIMTKLHRAIGET